jgi:hypothetical protein
MNANPQKAVATEKQIALVPSLGQPFAANARRIEPRLARFDEIWLGNTRLFPKEQDPQKGKFTK